MDQREFAFSRLHHAIFFLRFSPERLPSRSPEARRQAAVAVLVRHEAGRLEVLLMQRAVHPKDPWSGDACLPSGHWTAGDGSLLATAIRETREEVGLDLDSQARLLGALDSVRPFGPLGRLVMQPFVFALHGVAEVKLGSRCGRHLLVAARRRGPRRARRSPAAARRAFPDKLRVLAAR